MASSVDRYGPDVLATYGATRGVQIAPEIAGDPGLVVECADSGWCGAITGWERTIEGWAVRLEDRHGKTRLFPTRPSAFLIDGEVVSLIRPTPQGAPAQQRTASGSVALPNTPARVARASRIWVEGRHDAELVEKVWGDDLRIEGVVVELLDGADNLIERLSAFAPGESRRVGVLLDHLSANTKESRIAEQCHTNFPTGLLIVGHPFIDIWQAITPRCAGIEHWPTVARGEDWKLGVCERLGWPTNTGEAWRMLLGRVSRWTDLDAQLIGPVEHLIDFVTEFGTD